MSNRGKRRRGNRSRKRTRKGHATNCVTVYTFQDDAFAKYLRYRLRKRGFWIRKSIGWTSFANSVVPNGRARIIVLSGLTLGWILYYPLQLTIIYNKSVVPIRLVSDRCVRNLLELANWSPVALSETSTDRISERILDFANWQIKESFDISFDKLLQELN